MIPSQPNDETATCQTIPFFKPRHENLPLGEMRLMGSYLGGMRRRGIYLLEGAGMTVLIVSHMTKGGEVAGPAALEHAVDVAMVLRPTATGPALFVKKNRLGSANAAYPLLLELDDVTLRLATGEAPRRPRRRRPHVGRRS